MNETGAEPEVSFFRKLKVSIDRVQYAVIGQKFISGSVAGILLIVNDIRLFY